MKKWLLPLFTIMSLLVFNACSLVEIKESPFDAGKIKYGDNVANKITIYFYDALTGGPVGAGSLNIIYTVDGDQVTLSTTESKYGKIDGRVAVLYSDGTSDFSIVVKSSSYVDLVAYDTFAAGNSDAAVLLAPESLFDRAPERQVEVRDADNGQRVNSGSYLIVPTDTFNDDFGLLNGIDTITGHTFDFEWSYDFSTGLPEDSTGFEYSEEAYGALSGNFSGGSFTIPYGSLFMQFDYDIYVYNLSGDWEYSASSKSISYDFGSGNNPNDPVIFSIEQYDEPNLFVLAFDHFDSRGLDDFSSLRLRYIFNEDIEIDIVDLKNASYTLSSLMSVGGTLDSDQDYDGEVNKTFDEYFSYSYEGIANNSNDFVITNVYTDRSYTNYTSSSPVEQVVISTNISGTVTNAGYDSATVIVTNTPLDVSTNNGNIQYMTIVSNITQNVVTNTITFPTNGFTTTTTLTTNVVTNFNTIPQTNVISEYELETITTNTYYFSVSTVTNFLFIDTVDAPFTISVSGNLLTIDINNSLSEMFIMRDSDEELFFNVDNLLGEINVRREGDDIRDSEDTLDDINFLDDGNIVSDYNQDVYIYFGL